jgi:hypothetical protein
MVSRIFIFTRQASEYADMPAIIIIDRSSAAAAKTMPTMMMMTVLPLLLLTTSLETVHGASATIAHVVQFVVHANEKTDLTRLFPGAYVDFTWNNVFVVSIWTNDPDPLIKSIKETLDANTDNIKTLVAPYSLDDSTQKWLQYNLVWVLLLVLVFTAGCVCGATLIKSCFEVKNKVTTTTMHTNNNNNAKQKKSSSYGAF